MKTCEKCGVTHSHRPWTGLITLQIGTEFNWVVDEDWEVHTPEEAQKMMEQDVGQLLEGKWNDHDFKEEWTVTPDD